MTKLSTIVISVGMLPEWYLTEETNCDVILESEIENRWASQANEIVVEYNYQTENAIVTAYDYDGNEVWTRDNHDISYALDKVKEQKL